MMHSSRLTEVSASSSERVCNVYSTPKSRKTTRPPHARTRLRRDEASNGCRLMSAVNSIEIICLCMIFLLFNAPLPGTSSAVSRKELASGWPDGIPHSRASPLLRNLSTATIESQSQTQSVEATKLSEQSINQDTIEATQPARPRRSPLVANQFHSAGPKLIQWSREAVQYYEGSTLVLSCSLSLSGGEQPVKFAWFKNGKPLSGHGGASSQLSLPLSPSSSSTSHVPINQHHRLSIETLADYSFLRLVDLRPSDSGAYTCAASNSLGQEDKTTTKVVVNGSGEEHGNSSTTAGDENKVVKARAGESVVFECNASGGQPRPRVRWYRLMPTGGVTGAKIAPFTKTLGHVASGSQAIATTVTRTMGPDALDEVQMRALLDKFKLASRGDTPPFYRYELVNRNNDGLLGEDKSINQMAAAGNGSATGSSQQQYQFKWRVETSTSSAGSSAGENPHEIYSRLILDRLEPAAAGFYECDVSSSPSASSGIVYTNDQVTGASPGQSLAGSHDGLSQSAHLSSSQLQVQASGGAGEKLGRLFGLLVNAYLESEYNGNIDNETN